MKQKKTKTECLLGLTVFVPTVIKLGFFWVSGFVFHQGFETLVFGNPDETLALEYYVVHGLGFFTC